MHILTAAGASAKSLRSIQSDNMHFAKEHNKCLGSKLRDIFIYNEGIVFLHDDYIEEGASVIISSFEGIVLEVQI